MPEPRDRWSKIDIVSGILTPLLIFIFGTLISIQQHQTDESQKIADRVANLVKSLNSDKPGEQLTAIALIRLEKQRHPKEVPDELLSGAVPALVDLAINDRNPEVSKQAQQLVSEVTTNIAKSDPTLAQNVKDNVQNIPARVYIHIRDEKQRDAAKLIGNKLEEEDFNVPGIERLSVGPGTSELRYFRGSDKDGAERIVGLLHGLNLPDAQAKYIPGHENSKAMRDKHYELWISATALADRAP